MEIIPAMDLKDGKCVRLAQGVFSDQTVYSDSPLAVAQYYEGLGARRLHIVDLDGAETGQPKNEKVVHRILSECDLALQLGGGIRKLASLERWLEIGIERVIVSTLAVEQPEVFRHALSRFGGDHIVLAVDARDGKVAVRGWQQETDSLATDVALAFKPDGLTRVLYTDIRRDGMFSGPNLQATREMAKETGLNVIASGGVSSKDDLAALADLEPFGVDSVVVGKAFYERRILPEEVFHAG